MLALGVGWGEAAPELSLLSFLASATALLIASVMLRRSVESLPLHAGSSSRSAATAAATTDRRRAPVRGPRIQRLPSATHIRPASRPAPPHLPRSHARTRMTTAVDPGR